MSNAPNSTLPIQQESLQTTRPTSEATMFAMGGAINYLLSNAGRVGDCIMSGLDEASFQAQRDTTWILADGRNVAGSEWQTLTGLATVPDQRDVFPRGKSNGGSAAGTRGLNPDGNLAIGTYAVDRFKDHTHPMLGKIWYANLQPSPTVGYTAITAVGAFVDAGDPTGIGPNGYTPAAETSPKSTIWNFFVKINT